MTLFAGRLARPFLVEPQEILQLSQSARALGSCADDALSCLTAVRLQAVQPDKERLQRGADRRSQSIDCQTA